MTPKARDASLFVACHDACQPRALQRFAKPLWVRAPARPERRPPRIAFVGNTGCPTLASARPVTAGAANFERLRSEAAQWRARFEETCDRVRAAHRAVMAAFARAGAPADAALLGIVYAAESGAMHVYLPEEDRFLFLG